MDFNKPERINDKALEILQKRFDKVEPKFVKQVVDWISKFRTTSGNLVRSKENLARLGSFKTALNRFLEKAGYNTMVAGFLENFDEIGANTQLAQQELNGLEITKSFLNPFKRYAVNNVVAAMQGQGLNTNLINPIKNELLIAVNQGSSLTDVVTSIAGQLTTSEARQGVLKRISLQASRDALLQYDGIVNEAVRKSYKLDALLYVGSLVKDSRAQCERWVREDKNGKIGLILFEDLQNEIDWADDNGTGMIPDTTPENFCQNRGGYNCRHIAYPVRSANYIKEEKPKEEAPKEPEFVEAKTIEEAKSRMIELGVKNPDIDNYSKEQYNSMLFALQNVPKNAIPTILTDKKGYEGLSTLKIKRGAKEWMGLSTEIEIFDKKTFEFKYEKIVVINVSGFKKPDLMSKQKIEFNKKYSEQTKGSKWYFNEFDGATHFHELGHVYDKNISNKKEWIEIATKWHKESNFNLLKPSKGGDFKGENGSEAFAEAFASYFGNNKKGLPSYVIDFFNKNIK
jgi:hypothetical protein